MSLISTNNCSVPERLLQNFKAFILLAVFTAGSLNVFAQTIDSCEDFTAGAGAAWPYVLTATTIADGEASWAEQTFTMNVTSLPDGGANFRVFKTTANGGNYFGNLTALQLGNNTFTVSAVAFDRAVKFQFSSGEVGFSALSVNAVESGCEVSPPPATSSVAQCGDFASGPAAWPYILEAALITDGASSQAAQTFTMNVTSVPEGGANFRVYKTTANGGDYFGNLTAVVEGENTITVAAVAFDRAVKFQFSSGDIEFDALSLNGVASDCAVVPEPEPEPDPVPGCTDIIACNFDASATSDDGSCTYADAGFDCGGNCLDGTTVTIVLTDSYGDGWNGNSLTVGGTDYTQQASYGWPYTAGAQETFVGCLDLASCVSLTYNATGSYSYENSWSVTVNATGETYSSDALIGSCVTACTDELADNYNSAADISDNSLCEYSVVPGCTDMAACNYNADAGQDDGSCTYADAGFDCDGNCLEGTLTSISVMETSSWGSTYSLTYYGGSWDLVDLSTDLSAVTATSDDESVCLPDGCYEISGTSASGPSYPFGYSINGGGVVVPGAAGEAGGSDFVDLGGSCVTGCTDETATNFDATAHISDNSLCEYALVQGCTDAAACNYDETAEQDNGTCEYPAEGFDCEGSCLSGTYVVYSSGSFASENSFLISDCDGNELASMSSGFSGFAGCVELTDDYQLTLTDSYGDTWNGGSLTIGDVTYDGSDQFVGAGGNVSESVSYVIGSCGVPGCTDMTACNYDSTATFDDGSCTFALVGQDCDGNCLNGGTVTSISVMETSSWGSTYSLMAYGGSWSLVDISTSESVAAASSDNETLCLVDGCYEITGLSGSGASYPFGYSVDGGEIIVPGAAGEAGGTGYISVGETGCPSGCTDPLANNFDVDAIVDDGSCVVCVDGVEVSSSELAEGELPDDILTITISTGDWASEISWELYNNETDEFVIASGQTYSNDQVYVKTTGCLPDACYKLYTYDSYGDGWNDNGTFGITNQFGQEIVPTTVMGPNSGEDPDGIGGTPQTLVTYFDLGDASCDTYGCNDPLASNFDAAATVDDGSCIYCAENETDVTFSFNQENVTTDEVYVYNETDTVFSVEANELSLWEGKSEFICVPVGCYTISMGSAANGGWTDGSQLQILDDLTSDYFFLDIDQGNLDLQLVSIGGAECPDAPIGGCMDATFDNYNPDATFDNGTCAYECANATASNTVSVEEDAPSAPFAFVSSDVNGFGATVTFEVTESDADMVYHIYDCDSTQSTSFDPNSLSLEIDAGVSVYFAALDSWNTDSVATIVATVTELPDSAYWGCMEELACNYDSLATYEPFGSCEFAEAGFDCDGIAFPAYVDIELDFSTSDDLCNFVGDYSDNTVGSDYPGSSWMNDGSDMAYAFVSDGSSVSVNLFAYSDGTFNDGFLNVYNGNPLDSVPGTLVAEQSFSSSNDEDLILILDTDSGSTYFVIVDSDGFDCFEYDLAINTLSGVGGCTDSTALNYDATVDYEDGSCTYPTWVDVTLPYNGTDLTNCGLGNDFTSTNTAGNSSYLNGEDAGFGFVGSGAPVQVDLITTTTWTGLWVFDGDPLDMETSVVASETGSTGNESLTFDTEDGTSYVVVIDTWPSPNCVPSFDLDIVELVGGCTDTLAMNYDSTINFDDGSCVYDFVWGCIDTLACNYSDSADVDDGSCTYAAEGLDCDGNCLVGDTYVLTLGDDYGDGWNGGFLTIDGNDYQQADINPGFVQYEEESFTLCLDASICYDVIYTAGSWSSENSWSISDGSGNVVTSAGNTSGSFGACGVYGCMDVTATNYNSEATLEDGSCEYPVSLAIDLDYTTSGDLCNHVNDYDENNTNYEPGFGTSYMGGEDNAYYFTAQNGSVQVSLVQEENGTGQPGVFVFDGDPLDTLTNLVAEETGFSGGDISMLFESNDSTTYYVVVDHLATWGCYAYDLTLTQVFSGCMDSLAINYDASATIDDGSCEYDFVYGCIDELACNYVDTADVDDGSCIYPASEFVDCDGNCLATTVVVSLTEDYGDGSVSTLSVNGDLLISGVPDISPNQLSTVTASACIDLAACNSVTFDGNGDYWTSEMSWSVTDTSGNELASGGDYSNSFGIESSEFGDACPVAGCMDSTACNFDAMAEVDNGSCTFAQEGYDCDGLCLEDADADGICDSDEIAGCSDETALNFDPSATDDDGSCEFCTDNNILLVMEDDYSFGGWDGASFTMSDGTNTFTTSLNDGGNGTYDSEYICAPAGCYEVTVGGGSYDYEISFTLGDYLVDASAGTYPDISVGGAICNPMVVDFIVDMSSVGQPNMIDYDNVVINGTWNGWSGWGVTLSDDDGDNVWTGTGEFDPAIGQFEYVVAVTGPADGYSGWGMQWGNCDGSNFIVIFEEGISLYDAVPDLDCPEPTTFNVDMSCSGVEFTTVHLTGPIWGWTTDIIMTDEDGDGIYSITIDGLDGDVEYKYMVDYWAGQEDLIDDMVNGATCAPITDYSSYANRQVAAGSTTSDTYGSCDECGTAIPGCTDEAASNYNPAATEDDGTCDYCDAVTVNFSVDAGNVVSSDYDNVVVNGSFANWNGWGVTLTDEDGDGVYTGSTTVEANVTHEYVHALTGAADGWSGWGVIGYAPEACQLGVSETTGDASPNYYFSGGCGEVIDLPTVCFGECTECVVDVPGCTDASADNFDPNATVDDGSCTFCNSFEAVLLGTSDASAAGSSDGSVQATGQGGSNNYDVTVVDGDGVPQNPFALAAGDYTAVVTDVTSGCEASVTFSISEPVVADNPCDIVPSGLFVDDIIHNRVVFNWSAPSAAPSHYMIRYRAVGTSSWTVMTAGPVNSNEFTGTSRTRYFMEPGTTYEWNIRARVLNEDGSTNCQSSWSASNEYTTLDACANLENLSASTEAVWATLSADAPAAEWGVWQSKGKLRVVGTNSFRYVNGDSDGNISVLKGNFDPSTDYEWHTKAWCTGNVDSDGNSDPMYHSGWGDFSTFSTQAPCDKMPTNLTTAAANNAQTAITMSWDTPDSGAPDHYFLELTNVATGQVWAWNNIPGTDNSKSKYGLTAGEYSWRIRGACGTNGTSWATIFSQPVTYTLGGARLENSSVANLDVYPNPSRDIFNVSFTSEEAQTMTVKVVNMIGEEIFTEELTEFVGQYTKVIDMNTQPKGVYFLEITTSTGGINKKIVLQ